MNNILTSVSKVKLTFKKEISLPNWKGENTTRLKSFVKYIYRNSRKAEITNGNVVVTTRSHFIFHDCGTHIRRTNTETQSKTYFEIN